MPATKGEKPHRGKQVTVAEFRAMWYDPSLTIADIAAALNIGKRSVWQRAHHRGMPDRTTIIRMGPAPILDDKAKAMWEACVRREDIATLYGVHPSTVDQHVHRKGWRRGRKVNRWRPAISLTDFYAIRLREALACRAREEQSAIVMAEMRDFQRRRAA